MKVIILAALIGVLIVAFSFDSLGGSKKKKQQEVVEEEATQQVGEPLYFPKGEFEEHPSDLAPETDPMWEQEKARRKSRGESLDELYDEPTESYYESTTTYERVDEKKKKHKTPKRWE